MTSSSFPIRGASWGPCAVTVECLLSGLFPVAAKKKEEEEERARKEKAEKGVTLTNLFLVVLLKLLALHERLQADSVMMSAGSEG